MLHTGFLAHIDLKNSISPFGIFLWACTGYLFSFNRRPARQTMFCSPSAVFSPNEGIRQTFTIEAS